MENLKEAMNEALIDGRLPCAQAFAIAERMNVKPVSVGQAATQASIKISHCQLGLFGGAKQKHPPTATTNETLDSLKQMIQSRLVEGDLPCEKAWQIADELGVSRTTVSAIADTLNIRISACQLGCFN